MPTRSLAVLLFVAMLSPYGHRIRRSLILTPYDGPVIDESFDSACRVVSVATLVGDEPDGVTFRGNCLVACFVLVQGVCVRGV